MSKHTPGPWQYESLPAVVTDANRCIIAVTVGPERTVAVADVKQQRANARLIAAAPDLLEACNRLLMQVEVEQREVPNALTGHPASRELHLQMVEAKQAAREAIAKAE